MEITAHTKAIRISPRKMRLIADTIRKLSLPQALFVLGSTRKRAALPLKKTLESAVANAKNNSKIASDSLILKSVEITEGQALKRFHPSTRGRVHPYKKRSSNIRVVLTERGATK